MLRRFLGLVVLLAFLCLLLFSSRRPENRRLLPPDVSDTNKANALLSFRAAKTREEWVERYLKRFPNAHPLTIIGDYNSDVEFTKRWKPFSLSEMQTLITKDAEMNRG